jgi:hypothetical protein
MLQRLLLVLLLSPITAIAQQPYWQWAKAPTFTYSINPTYPRQVTAAYNGGVLWGAIQNKKFTYGSVMLGDYKLSTYDSLGNPLTSATINGKVSLTRAQADEAGNWYVLGFVYDTVELSSTMRIVTGFPGSQYFMARFHAGTLAPDWLQLIGSDQYSSSECFTIEGNNIYLPLDSSLTTKICRYDAATGARTTLWTQGGRSYTSYIDADAAGNIYLMGHCVLAGGLDYNGITSAPPTGMQYAWYIARYKANGQHHWNHWLGDITCNDRSFLLANNNAVYLSGPLMDSTTLLGHHFSKPTAMFSADYLMARLDSNGSLVWAQQRPITSITQGNIFFSSQFHMAAVDTMVYMYCESQGPCIWGNGIATQTTSNRHNSTLIAYGPTGTAHWASAVGASTSYSQHITTDGSNLWVTGVASDSTAIRFDTVSASTPGPGYLPYLAKLNINQAKATPPTSIANTVAPASVTIWPNPANTVINIHVYEPTNITIRDITGREVWTTKATKAQLQINTTTWPRGIYTIEARNSGKTIQSLSLQ